MGLNRISSAYLSRQTQYLMQRNLGGLNTLQEQIASGRNINRPSDDPVGMTQIIDLGNTLNLDERFSRNIQSALSELTVSDTTLSNVVDLIHRSQELATQGANFTLNASNRQAIAEEVDLLIDQLVQLSNTSIGGKYIYSGMRTNVEAYTRVGNDIAYQGNPAPQNFQRLVEVAENITVPVNQRGPDIFGAVTTAAGPPETIATGSGLFRTLMELKLNLEQNDPDQVRLRIDDLATDLDTVLAVQAQVGALTNRLELTNNRIQERKSTLSQQYADIQEVDMTKAISDLNLQESIFQASLGVGARVLQPSLLNFLR